jgi:hypothetical protein
MLENALFCLCILHSSHELCASFWEYAEPFLVQLKRHEPSPQAERSRFLLFTSESDRGIAIVDQA